MPGIDFENSNNNSSCVGNVIRILDEYTLLVNAGCEKLKTGDKVSVYTVVEPIINLDGSVLADYEYVKGVLEVIETHSKYSVCRTAEKETIESGILEGLILSPLFKTREEPIPLNVNKDDISPLKQIETKIQVGDPVKVFHEK